MNNTEIVGRLKTAKPTRSVDPLIRLWTSLGADIYWLMEMTHGAITTDEIEAWVAGQPIPKAQRARIASAFRVFLDSGETLLGREAVRNPRFATSPQFFLWSGRLNKARLQFEKALKGQRHVQ